MSHCTRVELELRIRQLERHNPFLHHSDLCFFGLLFSKLLESLDSLVDVCPSELVGLSLIILFFLRITFVGFFLRFNCLLLKIGSLAPFIVINMLLTNE